MRPDIHPPSPEMGVLRVLLLITRGDSIGGAQLHVRMLAERLHRDGHEVLVVAGTDGELADMMRNAGIGYEVSPSLQRSVNPIRDIGAVRDIANRIERFDPDIVAVHSSKAGVIGRIACRLRRTPCVYTAHGWAFTEGVSEPGRTGWRMVERALAPLAARIICVSQFDRDLAVRYGFHATRLVTIHNGIPDLPQPPARSCPQADLPLRLAMIARFSPQKDHATLLRAMQRIPNCELDLIGDGPLEASTKELAQSLGLADRVRFHGYQRDVASYLERADVFVLISHYEGFPLTTLEAMRAALPAIVTDVGGAGEAVIDGHTGYVVAPGDAIAIETRIRHFADNPEQRRAMGEAARARFLQEFLFERMYRKTLAAWRNAIDERMRRNGYRGPRNRAPRPIIDRDSCTFRPDQTPMRPSRENSGTATAETGAQAGARGEIWD